MTLIETTLAQLNQTLSQLTNSIIQSSQDTEQALNKISQNTQSEEYKEVFKMLKQVLNASEGKRAYSGISKLNTHLIEDAFKNIGGLSNYIKAVNLNIRDLHNKPDSLDRTSEIAKALGVNLDKVNKAILESQIILKKQQNYEDALNRDQEQWNQAGAGGKLKMLFSQADKKQRMAEFRDLVNQLKQQNPAKYQGKLGTLLAEEEVATQMRRRNIITADLMSGAPHMAGGSAAFDSMLNKFIKNFVTALSSSPFGQRLSNLASDFATMGTLALASKAPPWLQDILMGAIALGIPQSLGPMMGWIITSILSNASLTGIMTWIGTTGRLANIVAAGKLGLLQGGLLTKAGAIGATALTGGTSLLGGVLGGKLLFNVLGSLTDKIMGRDNNTGNLVKALTGAIGSGILIALVAAGSITGIVPVCLAIGGAIAGIWHLVQHLGKWWKAKDDSPGWLEKLLNWLLDHIPGARALHDMFTGGGGNSDQTTQDMASHPIVSSVNSALGGTGKLEASHFGGQLINTRNYTKDELNKKLATNKAYESIAGGGTGWSTDANSFTNDVMYAPTGTKEVLDEIVAKTGLGGKIIITSAMGSKYSPHAEGKASHYVGGGKLDISKRNLTPAEAKILKESGYFSRFEDEGDHYDTKIREDILRKKSDDYKTPKPAPKPKPEVPSNNSKSNISGTLLFSRALLAPMLTLTSVIGGSGGK